MRVNMNASEYLPKDAAALHSPEVTPARAAGARRRRRSLGDTPPGTLVVH
jgi:hypothetical protein